MVSVILDAFIAHHTPSLKSCNGSLWIIMGLYGAQFLLFCVQVFTAIKKEASETQAVYFSTRRLIYRLAE
jgi:hypothetical protein